MQFRRRTFLGAGVAAAAALQAPVVLGQVMTANDADPSVFWARGSSAVRSSTRCPSSS